MQGEILELRSSLNCESGIGKRLEIWPAYPESHQAANFEPWENVAPAC